jgi:hypothetical protein
MVLTKRSASCIAHDTVDGIDEVPDDLLDPGPIRVDSDTRDVDCARLQLDHEEDHVADRPQWAERLDSEEVAGMKRLPVESQELFPGSLTGSLWGGLDPRFSEDVGSPSVRVTVLRTPTDGAKDAAVRRRQRKPVAHSGIARPFEPISPVHRFEAGARWVNEVLPLLEIWPRLARHFHAPRRAASG